MKFAVASTAFRNEFESGSLDLNQWLTQCALRLGAGGAAIHLDHISETDENATLGLRRLFVDLQLTPVAIYMDTDFGLESQERRDRELERVEVGLRAARELGAPCLRIHAGTRRMEEEPAWRELVRCLKICSLLAEREGVTLAVENRSGRDAFLATSEEVASLIEKVESDWLRLNLNTGGFADGFQSIEKSLVYCANVNFLFSGPPDQRQPGALDASGVLDFLRQAGYRGFVTLDYEGEAPALEILPGVAAFVRKNIFGG